MNASQYFSSHKNYFWQWEDEEQIVAIPNSNTISYRPFIINCLEALAPQGIPRFGSLLLALIATNSNGKNDLQTVYSMMKIYDDGIDDKSFNDAFYFLNLLSELPSKYKIGRWRFLLLSSIFESAHRKIVPDKAHALIREFKNSSSQYDITLIGEIGYFKKDCHVFTTLYNQYKNIDQLLELISRYTPIEEEILQDKIVNVTSHSSDLMKAMLEHKSTYHVASLIKHIWAGLNIPYHNELPSQQAIGGISDLSTKGNFDRLVLSEFANEDMLFISRIANNEALYTNREIPPQSNDTDRIILIDVSIKNWGFSKTISHAVMMAIATHPKSNIKYSIFGIGHTYYPILIDTLDNILDSLLVLDNALSPYLGLNKFFAEKKIKNKVEYIYITSLFSYQNSSTQIWHSQNQNKLNYSVIIDESATIDVFKSNKQIQTFSIKAKEIWCKGEIKSPVPLKANYISAQYSYPLLFPVQYKMSTLIHAKGQFLTVNKNQCLFAIEKENKGWTLMYDHLIKNCTHYHVGKTQNDQNLILQFNKNSKDLSITNINTQKSKSINMQEILPSQVKMIIGFENNKFHIFKKYDFSVYWTIDFQDELIVKSNHDNAEELYRLIAHENEKALSRKEQDNKIMKKCDTIYINEKNNLVIHKNELRIIEHHNYVKITQPINTIPLHLAKKVNDTLFEFDDGSTIKLHKSGMLILSSSNNENIYSIALLQSVTNKYGLMRKLAFDSDRYNKNALRTLSNIPIIIYDHLDLATANQRIKEIKSICSDAVLELKSNPPVQIYISAVLDTPVALSTENTYTGNEFFIDNSNTTKTRVSPDFFWKKYIDPFIQHIINYGTKD